MLNNILQKSLVFLSDLSSTMGGFIKDIGGINFSEVPWEWWIAFFIVFVIFLSGFSYGKSRLFVSLLGLYIAAFIEPLFVYFEKTASFIETENIYIVHIILFFIIYFIVFVLLNRSSLKSRFSLKEFSLGPIIFLAMLKFGFLLSIILSYLPPDLITERAPTISTYFVSGTARFWWAVVPILGTLFLKPKES
ncbi:MAG: hypothetical protein Q8Q06_00945 [bacterium]|nr:hypothetical protein [bacterium]